MSNKYILIGQQPVPEADVIAWARWFENAGDQRTVCRTTVGDADVSTVFLALDHRFSGDGPPILWETMIFGGRYDGWQARHTSREEAEGYHHKIVEALRTDDKVFFRAKEEV